MFDMSQLPEVCQGEFGLKAFGGKVFKVNERASYNDQVVVSIITAEKTMDFSRCSVNELISQVRPVPVVRW